MIFGLAAQQTLGNLIAGTVLLSARPFRVGDRVRFQAGALGGQIEGVVMSLGLLYTTLSQGEDEIMVPNSMVLGAAVVPLREPAAVDLRARLPGRREAKLGPGPARTRGVGAHALEAAHRPGGGGGRRGGGQNRGHAESGSDGPQLADEILAAISELTADGGEHQTATTRARGLSAQ